MTRLARLAILLSICVGSLVGCNRNGGLAPILPEKKVDYVIAIPRGCDEETAALLGDTTSFAWLSFELITSNGDDLTQGSDYEWTSLADMPHRLPSLYKESWHGLASWQSTAAVVFYNLKSGSYKMEAFLHGHIQPFQTSGFTIPNADPSIGLDLSGFRLVQFKLMATEILRMRWQKFENLRLVFRNLKTKDGGVIWSIGPVRTPELVAYAFVKAGSEYEGWLILSEVDEVGAEGRKNAFPLGNVTIGETRTQEPVLILNPKKDAPADLSEAPVWAKQAKGRNPQ